MPQTELENAIAQIWQKVLKLDDIGIHDNFFDLGGHSLLLANVYSQLRTICTTELSMLDLFRYPTIATLADAIARTNHSTQTNPPTEQLATGRAKQKQRLEKMKSIVNGKGVDR
jgi:surfactin family lipopeptide synthetase C